MASTTHDFGFGPVPSHQHTKGGGWVADSADVAESAYIGPNAQVFGNARVCDNARVCGKAWVCDNDPEPSEEAAVLRLREIASIVLANPNLLRMSTWHTCKTTHCLAGHAQVLAGIKSDDDRTYSDGIRLLGRWGAPWFFESDEDVLDMLRQYLPKEAENG